MQCTSLYLNSWCTELVRKTQINLASWENYKMEMDSSCVMNKHKLGIGWRFPLNLISVRCQSNVINTWKIFKTKSSGKYQCLFLREMRAVISITLVKKTYLHLGGNQLKYTCNGKQKLFLMWYSSFNLE